MLAEFKCSSASILTALNQHQSQGLFEYSSNSQCQRIQMFLAHYGQGTKLIIENEETFIELLKMAFKAGKTIKIMGALFSQAT